MVDRAEEEVRLVQDTHPRGAQITEALEMRQKPDGVLVGRIAQPVPKLQKLDDGVDVERATRAELDVVSRVTLRLAQQLLTYVVDRGAQRRFSQTLPPLQNQSLHRFRRPVTERAVTGRWSRLEERLHL